MSTATMSRGRFELPLPLRPARVVNHPVFRVVVRRLLLAVPLLFVVTALSFVLVSLTPGNAARNILGGTYTPAQYQALQHQLGLNLPLYEQYWRWVTHAVTGDLGESVYLDQPVR